MNATRPIAQGLFLAPTVTAAALKGAIFAANVYERLHFKSVPNATEPRYDIIQAVEFGKPEYIQAFCEGIQAAAPVDSFVTQSHGICQVTTVRSLWLPVHLYPVHPLNFLPMLQ